MSTLTPEIRDLARRLIALETASAAADGPVGLAVPACEKLRVSLAKLVGAAGVHTLMSRALAMAVVEVPELGAVRVRPDGSLEHFDGIGRIPPAEAGAVVVGQLLGLLATFIGEPLTLRLVGDAWPDLAVDGTDRKGEGRS